MQSWLKLNCARGRWWRRRGAYAPSSRRACMLRCALSSLGALAFLGTTASAALADEALLQRASKPSKSSRTRVSLTTGFDYSTGDYGRASDTEILYTPLSIKVARGRYATKVTVPFIQVTARSDSATIRSRGLGDISAVASYQLLSPEGDLPRVRLVGRVKLPTSKRNLRLGSGVPDYTAAIDISKSHGSLTSFLNIGYRIVGGSTDRDLNDRRLLSAGFSYRLSRRIAGGLIYEYREASRRRAESVEDLVPYLSLRLSNAFRLTPYATLGLTDSSPDLGMGLTVTYSYR